MKLDYVTKVITYFKNTKFKWYFLYISFSDDLQPKFFLEEHSGNLRKEIDRYKNFLLK
nr:MAG TPA: hypothetical protein [Siphoviridae sp. ctTYz13]